MPPRPTAATSPGHAPRAPAAVSHARPSPTRPRRPSPTRPRRPSPTRRRHRAGLWSSSRQLSPKRSFGPGVDGRTGRPCLSAALPRSSRHPVGPMLGLEAARRRPLPDIRPRHERMSARQPKPVLPSAAGTPGSRLTRMRATAAAAVPTSRALRPAHASRGRVHRHRPSRGPANARTTGRCPRLAIEGPGAKARDRKRSRG